MISEPESQLGSVLLLLCVLAPLPYPGYVSITIYMYMYLYEYVYVFVYEQGIVCYARQEARIPSYNNHMDIWITKEYMYTHNECMCICICRKNHFPNPET